MPDTGTITVTADTAIDEVVALIRSFGVSAEDGPEGAFAADFNNTILADPYLEGTGWLPDRETAEAVAAAIIHLLNEIAVDALDAHPSWGSGWTHPESEATSSYATIVSAARDEWGEPVVEVQYDGDVWFMASVALGMLDDDQRSRLDKLNAAIRAARGAKGLNGPSSAIAKPSTEIS